MPSFEIQADMFMGPEFDEPLGESNTERRVKMSAGEIHKNAPNIIFIIRIKIFTSGVKILEFKCERKT